MHADRLCKHTTLVLLAVTVSVGAQDPEFVGTTWRRCEVIRIFVIASDTDDSESVVAKDGPHCGVGTGDLVLNEGGHGVNRLWWLEPPIDSSLLWSVDTERNQIRLISSSPDGVRDLSYYYAPLSDSRLIVVEVTLTSATQMLSREFFTTGVDLWTRIDL